VRLRRNTSIVASTTDGGGRLIGIADRQKDHIVAGLAAVHALPGNACSDYYRKNGVMMPADGADQLRKFDAILFGAVGAPDIPTQSGHLRALENRQSRGRHRAICREGPRCRCAAASLDHLVGAAEYR
jgi:hypothetical protein